MSEPLSQLAIRIRNDLIEIEVVLQRVAEGWNRAKRSADDYYEVPHLFSQIRAELLAFAEFLEQV